MDKVDRAYNFVRGELAELGLLYDGVYLDKVELEVTNVKSRGEAGYVFDQVGHYKDKGYRRGVIYLPKDTPHEPKQISKTLSDIIRHEFAHAWYCLDEKFFKQNWFAQAFGGSYEVDNNSVYRNWLKTLKSNPVYVASLAACKTKKQSHALFDRYLNDEFITAYATTNPSEDFAETFMFYLRYRRSLGRFSKRIGVQRKVIAVHLAIAKASQELSKIDISQKHAKSKKSKG
jgi:hypothetical protein